MKPISAVIFATILSLFFSPKTVIAQFENEPDSVIQFESLNDSIDLANTLNYFVDSLGYYMFSDESDSLDLDGPLFLSEEDFPANEIYNNFDSLNIHYPKFDFSTKTDTTNILLIAYNEKYVQPVPTFITSNFGWRKRHFHYGIDLQLRTGDTVVSSFNGVVRLTKRSRSYGYVVVVRHYNGLETLYAHLSKILVQPNQVVIAGEPLGLGGNTGHSFGSHLHWETRYLGAPINPNDVYDFTARTLKSDTLAVSKNTFGFLKRISTIKKGLRNVKVHTVKKGESLSTIAQKHGTTVAKLKKLNKLKGTVVRPKQKIRVR